MNKSRATVALLVMLVLGSICSYGANVLPIEVSVWATQTYDHRWEDVYSFGGISVAVPGILSDIGFDCLSFRLSLQENAFYNTIGASHYLYKATNILEIGLRTNFERLTFGVGYLIAKNDKEIYYIDKEKYSKTHCWIEAHHSEADARLSLFFSLDEDDLARYKIFRVPAQYDELEFEIAWHGRPIGLKGLLHVKAGIFIIRKNAALELSICPNYLLLVKNELGVRLYTSFRCSGIESIRGLNMALWYDVALGLRLKTATVEAYIEYEKDLGNLDGGYVSDDYDRITWGLTVFLEN